MGTHLGRPAGYLLHKYLRDPYSLNPVVTRRRKREGPLKLRARGRTNYMSGDCPMCTTAKNIMGEEARKEEV